MDPATLAAITQALAALLGGGGGGQDVQTAAEAPAGAGAGGVTPGFSLPTPGADLGVNNIAQDTGFLDSLSQQFSNLQSAGAPTVPLAAGAETPAATPTPAAPTITPDAAPASIGEILAASPEAMIAVAQLLGIGQQQPSTSRSAQPARGTQGSIVPGLQLPQGGQLGALLQQIPGLR